jgi:hypothetical protein
VILANSIEAHRYPLWWQGFRGRFTDAVATTHALPCLKLIPDPSRCGSGYAAEGVYHDANQGRSRSPLSSVMPIESSCRAWSAESTEVLRSITAYFTRGVRGHDSAGDQV